MPLRVIRTGPSRGSVSAKLFCSCSDRPVETTLRPTEGGTWASSVELRDDGPWYARVTLSGRSTSPVALPVGVPQAPRAEAARGARGPATTAARGPSAAARICSACSLGSAGSTRSGGLDGGRKLAVLALDDGGSPERAAQLSTRASARGRPACPGRPLGGPRGRSGRPGRGRRRGAQPGGGSRRGRSSRATGSTGSPAIPTRRATPTAST